MKAFLLAAGLGTRLQPLTHTVPKCLVPIEGRPLLDYWLELLDRHGIAEALVNLHHLPQPVEAYLDRQPYAVQVRTSYEPDLLGSAGTVVAHQDWVRNEEAFWVIYTDNLSTIDLARFGAFHQQHQPWLTMVLYETPVPEQCGIAEIDETGKILAFTEKPAHPHSPWANGGVYLMGSEALQWMTQEARKQPSPVFDFGHDVLPHLQGKMHGFRWTGYHLDIGTWENYARARRDAAAGKLAARNP